MIVSTTLGPTPTTLANVERVLNCWRVTLKRYTERSNVAPRRTRNVRLAEAPLANPPSGFGTNLGTMNEIADSTTHNAARR